MASVQTPVDWTSLAGPKGTRKAWRCLTPPFRPSCPSGVEVANKGLPTKPNLQLPTLESGDVRVLSGIAVLWGTAVLLRCCVRYPLSRNLSSCRQKKLTETVLRSGISVARAELLHFCGDPMNDQTTKRQRAVGRLFINRFVAQVLIGWPLNRSLFIDSYDVMFIWMRLARAPDLARICSHNIV